MAIFRVQSSGCMHHRDNVMRKEFLNQREFDRLREIKRRNRDKLFRLPNVNGVGIGYKEVNGEPTDQIAIRVYVEKKVTGAYLSERRLVPSTVDGVITDVIEVGKMSLASHRTRERPVRGGDAIGRCDGRGADGTLGGACFYDNTDNDRVILTCNHVVTGCVPRIDPNDGELGDWIAQPGTLDGAVCPQDLIAGLKRFIEYHRTPGWNQVDAAIATAPLDPSLALDEIHDIGTPVGCRALTADDVNSTTVQKSGAVSQHTQGTVTDISYDFVTERCEIPLQFEDQILITGMVAEAGDSGALILDTDKNIVGLLIAIGGVGHVAASNIGNVLSELNIRFGLTLATTSTSTTTLAPTTTSSSTTTISTSTSTTLTVTSTSTSVTTMSTSTTTATSTSTTTLWTAYPAWLLRDPDDFFCVIEVHNHLLYTETAANITQLCPCVNAAGRVSTRKVIIRGAPESKAIYTLYSAQGLLWFDQGTHLYSYDVDSDTLSGPWAMTNSPAAIDDIYEWNGDIYVLGRKAGGSVILDRFTGVSLTNVTVQAATVLYDWLYRSAQMTEFDSELYFTGFNKLFSWDGATCVTHHTDADDYYHALIVINGLLYIGNGTVGHDDGRWPKICTWDGAVRALWTSLDPGASGGGTFLDFLHDDRDGTLYALTGSFDDLVGDTWNTLEPLAKQIHSFDVATKAYTLEATSDWWQWRLHLTDNRNMLFASSNGGQNVKVFAEQPCAGATTRFILA